MINFEEEIERFKPSLEIEAVSETIVKSDLTDMADLMMEIMKEIKDTISSSAICSARTARPKTLTSLTTL